MKGKNYCDLRWWQELLSGRRTFGDGTIPELPTKEPKMNMEELQKQINECHERITTLSKYIDTQDRYLTALCWRERDRQWEQIYKEDPSWINAQERATAFAEVMAAKAEEYKRLDMVLPHEDHNYFHGYCNGGRKITMALEYPCQVLIWDKDKVTFRQVLVTERPGYPYQELTGPGCEKIHPDSVISYRKVSIEPQGSDV